MSNPGYSRKLQFTPSDLITQLRQFSVTSDHEFWADQISLCDETIFAKDRIHSSRQLTDLYLLALAVAHRGRLVTFDAQISTSAIHYAKIESLCVL